MSAHNKTMDFCVCLDDSPAVRQNDLTIETTAFNFPAFKKLFFVFFLPYEKVNRFVWIVLSSSFVWVIGKKQLATEYISTILKVKMVAIVFAYIYIFMRKRLCMCVSISFLKYSNGFLCIQDNVRSHCFPID